MGVDCCTASPSNNDGGPKRPIISEPLAQVKEVSLPEACTLPCCQDYVMLATKINNPDAPPDDTNKINLLPLRKADI